MQVDRSLSPAGQLGASAGGILSNLFGSIEQRFIFYRKSRRRDVQNVVDVQLVEQGTTPPSGDGWHRVKTGLRSKVMRMMSGEKTLHLYYRTVLPAQTVEEKLGFWKPKRAADTREAITELDLVYGDNPPWPSFVSAGIISSSHPSMAAARVTLTYRRKPVRKPPLTPLTFRPDGSFKILQLADLHFSISPEPCRDINPHDARWTTGGCVAKNDTLALVEHWLDTERPDLVVLSGDQLNGQGTSWDPKSVLSLYATPLIARRIPYAVILGNHDSESGSLTRDEQMQLIAQLPYSYASVGPALVTGSGNYYLKLHAPVDQGHVATLWFLDTGSRAEKDAWKPWSKPGYGYVHSDQIGWFERKYTAIQPMLLPYKPDGAKDLPPQNWRRDTAEWDAAADEGRTMGRPPSIVFMHIPVPEAFNPVDRAARPHVANPSTPDASSEELIVGERKETATREGAQSQPGIFDLFTTLNNHPNPADPTDAGASLHAAEHSSHAQGGSGGGGAGGVKLVLHGHMHLNSDCRRVSNVWICFGGGASFAAYGSPTVQRRARVVVLEQYAARIRTYHRIASTNPADADRKWDEFVLNYDT